MHTPEHVRARPRTLSTSSAPANPFDLCPAFAQIKKLWNEFRTLPNTDISKLPDQPDLSTFNPIALEKSQVDIVKNISMNYSALLGTGVFPLVDKLNALALKLPNQREPVVMKEEKVFGEESAYTFNHEALSIEKIIQLLEDYGFITTVYEGFEGM